jgi:hypothetical protein
VANFGKTHPSLATWRNGLKIILFTIGVDFGAFHIEAAKPGSSFISSISWQFGKRLFGSHPLDSIFRLSNRGICTN